MNRLPMERHRPQGDAVHKPYLFDLVDDLLRERRAAAPGQAGCGDDGGNHPLNNLKHRQHKVEAITHRRLCQREAEEQLESLLRALDFGQGSTGFDQPDCEKQHQQAVSDGFQRPVDVQHHLPDPAAFEGGGILREQRPDLGQLVVPGFQRIG